VIAGPTLVLGLPLLAAALVYLLRRWALAAATVATLIAAALAWMVWQWPPQATVLLPGRTLVMGQPVTLLGQELLLTPASQPLLTFTCALAAVCFLYAGCISQGRTFFPFGLVLLSLFNATLLTQPLTRAPLPLAFAAALAVYVIQAGRPGSTRGALRWLLFPVLAFPFFLVAAWYLDQVPLNPDDPAPFAAAARLMAYGFLFLLMAVPLHGAVPALTAEAPPLVSAFLLLSHNGVTLYLLNALLRAYPWLVSYHDVSRWLLWLGLITAGWSGLLAAGQREFGRLWGYASLCDFAGLLVALGLGAPVGLPLGIFLFIARAAALVLGALGLATLRHRARGDGFQPASGMARRLPWSVAALLAGGLALAGFPLTVGFSGHWTLLQYLGQQAPRAALLLLLGAAGVIVGYLRGLRVLLGPLHDREVEREPRLASGLVAVLLLLCLLVCLRPQLLSELVSTITAALGTVVEVGP